MNVIALIAALIGIGLLVALVYFGNKINNSLLRYSAIMLGIFFSIIFTGMIPTLLGDENVHTSSKAGEYMLYIGIFIGIIRSVFFKNKKQKPNKSPSQNFEKAPQKNENICPNCGSSLSIKKATKGKYAGQSFRVCNNYPTCKTVLALQSS